MRGSILTTFNEYVNDKGLDYITVTINGVEVKRQATDIENAYTMPVNTGDTVLVQVGSSPTNLNKTIDIYRRDFTIDDVGGNNGIVDTFITGSSGTGSVTATITASTVSNAYGFLYIVSGTTSI